ncbi:hypothetical protein C5167_008652 [Papaver somniferum]|uniref:Uncharacterized protein n=1 Tax=Papaver somniferum TaxID=3469 RepID=A0A4Y7JZ39_PAPSO|nr:hypothetical protein C5167_008652 [Papaver somniferum]
MLLKCWLISHLDYRCNMPTIVFEDEENARMIIGGNRVQGRCTTHGLASAVSGLRIYDSAIDQDQHSARDQKRQRILHDVVDQIRETNSADATYHPTSPTDKGKNLMPHIESGKGKTVVTVSEETSTGQKKFDKQQQKYNTWARMLNQYVDLGVQSGRIHIRDNTHTSTSSMVPDQNPQFSPEWVDVAEDVRDDGILPRIVEEIVLSSEDINMSRNFVKRVYRLPEDTAVVVEEFPAQTWTTVDAIEDPLLEFAGH